MGRGGHWLGGALWHTYADVLIPTMPLAFADVFFLEPYFLVFPRYRTEHNLGGATITFSAVGLAGHRWASVASCLDV